MKALTIVRVTSAIAGQKTPDGYHALDRMLRIFSRHGGNVACCGTCLDARGLTKERLIDEATRSTIDELADWTVDADQVLTFQTQRPLPDSRTNARKAMQ